MDLKHGYGSYKWSNGQKYIGLWYQNMRHGHGGIKKINGTYLEG